MITTKDLETKIDSHVRLHSGLETRHYLGMSQVAHCIREAYDGFMDGGIEDRSDFAHRMCYVGYLFEQDTLRRLREMRIATFNRRELVSDFDDRLRGHIDGETVWGDLLEIKSVTRSKFELVCKDSRALHEHNDQVQLYMRYGGWKFAWIVYVCRENFEHKVIRVRYDEVRALRLEEKARRILAAIDARQRPECECGYCIPF